MIHEGIRVMTDRERLLHIIRTASLPYVGVGDPVVFLTDILLKSGVTFASTKEESENAVPYEARKVIYLNALSKWGDHAQMIVAIEELSECQKEICKILRGGENFPHLAEEIADATIMLEQLCLIFNLDAQVNACMDTKVRRLEKRIEGYSGEK